MYRVSIKSFPDYKQMFTWTCWNFTLHLRIVSAVDNFSTRWRTSTLGFTCSSVFGCNISKQADWERRSDTLATTITGYHHLPRLLFMSCVCCNICNIWFLDATFPNRWIGRDGPTPWPPRSPDITTSLDFFLCHVFVVTFVTFGFLGWNISKQADWERWSDTLATTITGYHHLPRLLFMSCVCCNICNIWIFGMQHFQTGGLGEMVRHPGHHDHRISPPP